MYNCRGLNSATSLPDKHVFGREVRPEPDAVKPWRACQSLVGAGGRGVAQEEGEWSSWLALCAAMVCPLRKSGKSADLNSNLACGSF